MDTTIEYNKSLSLKYIVMGCPRSHRRKQKGHCVEDCDVVDKSEDAP